MLTKIPVNVWLRVRGVYGRCLHNHMPELHIYKPMLLNKSVEIMVDYVNDIHETYIVHICVNCKTYYRYGTDSIPTLQDVLRRIRGYL